MSMEILWADGGRGRCTPTPDRSLQTAVRSKELCSERGILLSETVEFYSSVYSIFIRTVNLFKNIKT